MKEEGKKIMEMQKQINVLETRVDDIQGMVVSMYKQKIKDLFVAKKKENDENSAHEPIIDNHTTYNNRLDELRSKLKDGTITEEEHYELIEKLNNYLIWKITERILKD